jgi:hypothetical protein
MARPFAKGSESATNHKRNDQKNDEKQDKIPNSPSGNLRQAVSVWIG